MTTVSNRIAAAVATWFGCGYATVAPGTVGSAAAIAIAIPLAVYAGWRPWHFAILAAALLPLSIWSAGATARAYGKKDPGIVVVDEVVGQWFALAGAGHFNWKSWLGAFLLFRLLDIWKPPPARQLEALPSGTGIVADDVIAGIYAALVLLIAGWFNLY
jgi:phosphatidylglycerophosphatase A